ncbi:hypothetical protein ABPG77_002587 [Micractinium sp. CCAP 211/92]
MLMLSSPTASRAALTVAQQLQRCAPLAAPLVVAVPSVVRHDFHSRFGLVRSCLVCHAVQPPEAAGEIEDGTQTGSSIPPSNGGGGVPARKPIDWEEAGIVLIKAVSTVGILALLALLFKPMLAFLIIGPVIWVVHHASPSV